MPEDFPRKISFKISFKFGSRFSKRISLSVLAQIVKEFLKVYLEVLQAYLKTTFPVLSLSSSWSLVGRREEETSYCIGGRVPSILNIFLAIRETSFAGINCKANYKKLNSMNKVRYIMINCIFSFCFRQTYFANCEITKIFVN